MDYYPTGEPEVLRAGHVLLSQPTTTLRTEHGRRLTVDDDTWVKHTDDEDITEDQRFRWAANNCWGSQKHAPCVLGEGGDYSIGVHRRVPDGHAILTGLAVAGVVSLVGGYVTANVTCFTSWCDDYGKGAFVAGDVVLGLAAATVVTLGFFAAVMRGLNN